MAPSPLQQPCPHLATPAELERDPTCTACAAAPGKPCRWARRYDGLSDPPFHSERLELAVDAVPGDARMGEASPQRLRQLILDTGLI